jgi:hypothetical protein
LITIYLSKFLLNIFNPKHDYIIAQIKDFPERAVAEKWLKSGYVDNNVFNRINK